jgi:hypothetical protein
VSDYQETNGTQPGETAGEDKHDPISEFLRHQQRAVEETGKALDSLLPPGFKEHGKIAGREFVSGMKVLFDAAVDGLEKAGQEFDKNFNRQREADDSDDRPSSTGTTKVKVQVD